MNEPILHNVAAGVRRRTNPRLVRISASLALSLVAALTLVIAAGCKKSGAASKPADVDYYTCTMHPSVKSQDPKGKCPICGMDLVPVMKQGAAAPKGANPHAGHENMPGMQMPGMPMATTATNAPETPTEFTVPVERQQQIGVTYAAVTNAPLALTIRAVGSVAYDKQRHWDYVSRVDGYVQKLFVFSRGELVEKDAPLLTIYSPDLLTTQNEFVDVLKTRDANTNNTDRVVQESMDHLVDSARRRLRLWNITDGQIAELEKSRKPQEFLTLKSPFKGTVQELAAAQGGRTMTGDRLVDIADLWLVWVWAQFYENELALLKRDLPVTITTAAYPGETFKGKIALVDPFLNDASRTARVRVDVDNPDLKLRPDMYVNVELNLDMGTGLALPVSAVLPTGQHNIVFVDKGEGKLEPRFIELGRKYGDIYELKSGATNGERVVNSANFLIDAEAKVQGALKSW